MRRSRWHASGAGFALVALAAGMGTGSPGAGATQPAPTARAAIRAVLELPHGGRRIYPGSILVAYYGTAGTAALGVLGEDSPDLMTTRLRRAARPFAQDGAHVQIVYELIVTIADAHPGADGDYSHDIDREHVRRYIAAAHRNNALLVLDLQPGRTDFLTVAKRWRWALRDPWVGLALDPEWRMAPGQVPARTVGQVRAREINKVSRWLGDLALRREHPQKILMVHQFRSDMVINIENVRRRGGLAMIQHVDGFGSQAQKLSTYHAVARPDQFHMGLKLFYDEDSGLMSPERVQDIRPPVQFVSYQ